MKKMIRRINSKAVIYSLCFIVFIFFLVNVSQSQPPLKPQAGLDKIQPPSSVIKIQSLNIRTESDGKWVYEYEIINKGFAPFNLQKGILRAYQILTDNREILLHKVSFPQSGMLAIGAVNRGKFEWQRCFNAKSFRLEIWENDTKMLDSKTINILQTIPLQSIQILKAEIQRSNNTWFADIKNNLSYGLNIIVKIVAKDRSIPAGQENRQFIPANGRGKFSGNLNNIAKDSITEILAIYENPNICPNSGQIILDRKEASAIDPDVSIINFVVNGATRYWVADIKNDEPYPVTIKYTAFPLEHGQAGSNMFGEKTIAPKSITRIGDSFSNYLYPSGTRFKLIIDSKEQKRKLDEKIAGMN